MAEVNAASGNRQGSSGAWVGTGDGVQHKFLGLKFKIEGKIHFGWARFNVTVPAQGATIQATLTGYAYETIPNKPALLRERRKRQEVKRGCDFRQRPRAHTRTGEPGFVVAHRRFRAGSLLRRARGDSVRRLAQTSQPQERVAVLLAFREREVGTAFLRHQDS